MALIQSVISTIGGATSFTKAPARGNLIVAVLTNTSPIGSGAITDNQGHTYAQVGDQATATTSDHVSIFYVINTPTNGGTFTITGTGCLAIYEYSNIRRTAPLITSNFTNGSSGSPSTSVTTTLDNCLYVVAEVDAMNAASYTQGTGYALRQTQLDTTSHERQATEDQVTTRGTITGNFTVGSSGEWAIMMAAFAPAPAKLPNSGLRPHPFSPGLAR